MLPKINKILYASDLSENSMPAFAWAMMLADRHNAQITFLHVIEAIPTRTVNTIRSIVGEDNWKVMAAEQDGEINAKIEARINQFCDDIASEMDSCPMNVEEIVITRNVPVESILQEAGSRNCDLILMGTHGAGLFKDAMIGSTARRVLRRSKIPTIVIPLAKKE